MFKLKIKNVTSEGDDEWWVYGDIQRYVTRRTDMEDKFVQIRDYKFAGHYNKEAQSEPLPVIEIRTRRHIPKYGEVEHNFLASTEAYILNEAGATIERLCP